MKSTTHFQPIVLPELGTGEETIRVSTWLVDLDEEVEAGERMVDVLIPGIAFSVSSPGGGRLAKIERPPNSSVQPGEILGWLEPLTPAD